MSLNLLYTDVEDDLRSSVRDLVAARSEPNTVLGIYDGDRSVVDPLWRAIAGDLGLAGLLIPEERGGAGASAREAAVVLEELGRSVAPVPFLTSSVVATTVLLAAAPGGAADELLAGLAAGERTAALVLPLSAGPGEESPAFSAEEGRISGSARSVAGAIEADVLLVPVATAGGTAVYAVAAADARIEPVVSLDMTRQLADVTLEGVAGQELLGAGEGGDAVRRGLEVGAALLTSEQYGVAQWCLTTTIAYLKDRRQFGRVVGGYQALKHRLADLYAAVESAGAAARYAAAATADEDPETVVATAVAQSFCSDVAVKAAEEAVQLHGGIGMTWEHPAHLYLKRAKADQIALGTPAAHRARLAELVDLPAPAPVG
ncbi:acyl-CoA dehydrogenase family protein [Blastococcus goldschmidtiae]|uniref:Acyl-CoA dehydrogenase family protein n=1 Tax=Blastococcus goldschmidtiae TaxID=3075546 RepID=A0ABU2K5F7_9ACTN|nr:acyl-CoA dehydrogenase family protein [Blastococcus sp. DSM 46792]MDT0275427.1 acyl-CoA dehydrogenase family protein [Blastococcus sp. DSM 46792]